MSDFSFEGIKRFLDRKKSKFINVIKKIVAGILGVGVIGSGVLALIFLSIVWMPLTIYFAIQGGLFLILALLVFKIPDLSKKHYINKEIKECEELLSQIKKFVNENDKLKNEFRTIVKDLNDGLKDAKNLAEKIYGIEKTLSKKEWDIDYVEKKLKNATSEIEKKRLTEQKDNINKLLELQAKLIDQLLSIKHTFNSVYTKLTLLDTSNKIEFDAVETEIKKVFDFKLKVAKYEEELDKELKI